MFSAASKNASGSVSAVLGTESFSSEIQSKNFVFPVQVPKKEKEIDGKSLLLAAFILGCGVCAYAGGHVLVGPIFRSDKALLCAVISLMATLLWAFHLLPLEVTSLGLIPVIVFSGILAPEMPGLSVVVFSCGKMLGLCVSRVAMLLMGSCLLSAYFEAHGGGKMILPYLVGKGDDSSVLFKTMFFSVVLSSLMSNVAAPIIILSVMQTASFVPHPATVIGIAMGANLGGMLLPISSPQSVLGSSYMGAGWLEWLAFSVPTVLVCFLAGYVAIHLILLPNQSFGWGLLSSEDSPEDSAAPREASETAPGGAVEWKIVLATVVSVVCWAVSSSSKNSRFFCAVPILLLSLSKGSSRVFNRKTLEILSIAIAGTALGEGIATTGVLEDAIQSAIAYTDNHSLAFMVVVLSFLMLGISCLVCHTVSAVVLLPIFQKVGAALNREQLILATASLACSCGMALPTSGFPNIIASSYKGPDNRRIISTRTFVALGSLFTVFSWGVILTLGVFVMGLIGY
ncbi:phosphate transporter [Nematocida displodere]|uniref:Phosphate transporter n=1 Tax=Nematocida displodere TaxID=1805483 RepID=A0A177EIE3_9MICR|nr:phosphate transporter [Nematocida displodere]